MIFNGQSERYFHMTGQMNKGVKLALMRFMKRVDDMEKKNQQA